MAKQKVRTYTSDDIDVTYSVKRCIHARECVNRLNAVFDTGKRPWVQPDNAPADTLADTIDHCPTGALHYIRKDGGREESIPGVNTLHVQEDGPIYVRGDLEMAQPDDEPLTDTRIALCRCGESHNKPFCDNSHIDAEFKATDNLKSNLEESGEQTVGGALKMTPIPNGPVLLEGNFTLVGTDGETIFHGTKAALCRCGHSKNKTFCDGTHTDIGFEAE